MAYTFQKLNEVPSVDNFPEGGKVLINDNGDIKQCATAGLGGGGYDAVFVVDGNPPNVNAVPAPNVTATMTVGNYETLYTKFVENQMPISAALVVPGMLTFVFRAITFYESEPTCFLFPLMDEDAMMFTQIENITLYPDGTIEVTEYNPK